MKNKLLYTCLVFILTSSYLFAQEESKTEIDPSKPTNLYTQINTVAEIINREDGSSYGTRFNFQYTFNPNNLVLAEVPFLYNDQTQKFGISDVRVRYFSVVKRNISKSIIAIAPFLDITAPTGSLENGLGSDSWSLGTGVVAGIAVNKKISLFPGVNYVYLTASEESGFGLQTNMSVSFNKRSFLFVNPIVTFFSFDTIYQAELNYNYVITPNKFKMNLGWFPNFTNNINDFRIGATFFL